MGKLSKDIPATGNAPRKKLFYSLEEFETFLFGTEDQKESTNKATKMEILAGLEAFLPVLG